MFFLKLKCRKCGEVTEVISKPNATIKNVGCGKCSNEQLVIEEAQEMSAKAVMACLKELNDRVTTLEDLLLEEHAEQ